MAQKTARAPCECPQLLVSRWNNDAKRWTDEWMKPSAFIGSRKDPFKDSQITLVRTKARTVRKCEFCRRNFTDVFHMPELWWSEYYRNSNGYFGCDTVRDQNDKITSHTGWSRFLIKQLYKDERTGGTENRWYEINMFTQWIAANNETVVLLFDAPQMRDAQNRWPPADVIPLFKEPKVRDQRIGEPADDRKIAFRLSLLHRPEDDSLSDAFWIHARTLGEVAALQDEAVWTLRTHLRTLEKSRNLGEKPNPDYGELYELLRHAVHISETLDVAVRSAGSMVLHHREYTDDCDDDGGRTKKEKAASKRVRQRLLALEHVLDSLRARAASNKERLLNEIQLSFNSVSQFDAKVTLADSKAMKAIAFLTMAFLPATFICAIFSMSFFNYDAGSGEWNMSSRIWVYWAFALPVTALTVLAGGVWLGDWQMADWKRWKKISA